MSSSIYETFSMLEQKFLTKKPEALHLLEEFTMIPIESPHPLIPEYPDRSPMTEEELRRLDQAELAHILKRRSASRLLGEDKIVRKHPAAESMDLCWADPRVREIMYPKRESHWILQLPDVILEGTLGTLEARGSGFIFTAPDFHMHFKDTSVKECFFLRGDGRRPHLVQFHLHDPMMVGTKERKDIQFSLAEQGSYADRGEELDNFVRSVGRAQWDSYAVFHMLQDLNKFQFIGVLHSGLSADIALTDFSLVLLMEPPFCVVPLYDVEIVNLAQVESGPNTVVLDMTVVFKDYSHDVLQICAIDVTKLAGIKRILNSANVKYYCNSKKLDQKEWNSILRDILACPKLFIESGGWESLQLEDELTLSCYAGAEEPDYGNGVFQ